MIYRWRVVCVVFIAISSLASGCATIVKGGSQELTINTDPVGATCDLSRSGALIGSLKTTPGVIDVRKDSNDIEVSCRKSGYKTTSGRIASSFEGWTLGNFVLGGIIGLAVDAGSGALHQYETELFVKLAPEKFESADDRQAFFEKWREDILRYSAKAKVAAARQCSGAQCDEVLKRIDQETLTSLAGLDAERTLRAKSAIPERTVSAAASATASVSPAVRDNAAGGSSNSPSVGNRWRYRLIDGKRPVGMMTVEILEARDSKIKERVTRDDWKGFIAEREVDSEFGPKRFQEIITLPGGFQLAEISPYVPAEPSLTQGQVWPDISGVLLATNYGKRRILAEARVVGRETVNVPAGTFDTWHVQAVSNNQWGGAAVKFTFNYWYAPKMLRAVKMSAEIDYQVTAPNSAEIYELVAFDRGQ